MHVTTRDHSWAVGLARLFCGCTWAANGLIEFIKWM